MSDIIKFNYSDIVERYFRMIDDQPKGSSTKGTHLITCRSKMYHVDMDMGDEELYTWLVSTYGDHLKLANRSTLDPEQMDASITDLAEVIDFVRGQSGPLLLPAMHIGYLKETDGGSVMVNILDLDYTVLGEDFDTVEKSHFDMVNEMSSHCMVPISSTEDWIWQIYNTPPGFIPVLLAGPALSSSRLATY